MVGVDNEAEAEEESEDPFVNRSNPRMWCSMRRASTSSSFTRTDGKGSSDEEDEDEEDAEEEDADEDNEPGSSETADFLLRYLSEKCEARRFVTSA